MSYAWRNDSTQKLQHKGAWISKVTQWGQEFYAGVGYALVPPAAQPPQPDSHAHGMYGFVCTADGLLLAHGASPAFVGRTLAEVLEATANTSIDQPTLLKRFHAAARLGGGWVTYPWRLSKNAPLRTKGCFVTRHAAQQGARHASSSSESEMVEKLKSRNRNSVMAKSAPRSIVPLLMPAMISDTTVHMTV